MATNKVSRLEDRMTNTGNEPMIVPGFGGLPIDFEFDKYSREPERFGHGANDWSLPVRLTAREISMLELMNALTEKPNWNQKVFNEGIVEKWYQEALMKPLISEKTWEWCLTELRDMARQFEKTGFVPAFDNWCGCIKSDGLVGEELRQELVQAVQPLLNIPTKERDWHPRSNDKVLNLVHPSLFPLVYGQTKVLSDGGRVGLDNMLDSYGKGKMTTLQIEVYNNDDRSRMYGWRRRQQPGSKWSTRFQWLPCEVEFQGESGNDVKITSYINNLHPRQNKNLYGIIEKLISLSIEPWNRILVYPRVGRTPPRIRTYGSKWSPPYPEWAEEVSYYTTREKLGDEKYNKLLENIEEYMKLPENPNFVEEEEAYRDEEEIAAYESYKDGSWKEDEEQGCLMYLLEYKWKRLRQVVHPEAGEAYSYEDWKAGRVQNTVIASSSRYIHHFREPHSFYEINLSETWRDKGLQVIVKLASIELTPEKPKYDGGSWHIEGMLNEHIAATSIYYYDVDNTTESRIRFRQEAQMDSMDFNYEQSVHEPLCEIFGVDNLTDEIAVQELGSISTPQGRLLAFPNTLQHCVQPFELADPTRPGHRRFIVMWLVDPHYRITSTRNVPPQRHDWWAPHGYHHVGIEQKLPAELANMITEDIGEWPMGLNEAKKLRLELMEERTHFMPLVETSMESYNFCEH